MKREEGQTLIEILLAVGIAAAIITAITAVVISALNNATFRKNQNLATSYAQQGMEMVRVIRDRSWTDFFNLPGGPNFCLPENSSALTPRTLGLYCTSDGTKDGVPNVGIFVREIILNNNNPDCESLLPNTKVKVTVKVQWKDSKCTSGGNPFCHEVKLISCLTKINLVPTP